MSDYNHETACNFAKYRKHPGSKSSKTVSPERCKNYFTNLIKFTSNKFKYENNNENVFISLNN